MRRGYENLLLSRQPREVRLVIALLDLFYKDRKEYAALMAKAVPNGNRKKFTAGWPTTMEILQACFELDTGESKGVKQGIVESALGRLSEWGFVGRQNIPNTLLADCWTFNDKMKERWSISLAEDICFGVLFVLEKYRPALLQIIVETMAGDEEIGTGFLIDFPWGPDEVQLCITNKHVAGGSRIKRIKEIKSGERAVSWEGHVESDRYDLAVIAITELENVPRLRYFPPILLDDVIALGFPKVAVTAQPHLLAHKGEISGEIVNRFDNQRYLVVSCQVAPGNSGGPLINEAAEVVGVVSQSSVFKGIGDAVEQVGVHHLAIPIDDVFEFLKSPAAISLMASSLSNVDAR